MPINCEENNQLHDRFMIIHRSAVLIKRMTRRT